MTIKLSTGLRNKLAGPTGFGATFEKGVLYIYSGPQPLSADNAVTGTLLAIVTKDGQPFVAGAPDNGLSFDAPVAGVVSKAAADNWKCVALADGTAGWFRLMGNASDALGQSTTLPRMDGHCGTDDKGLQIGSLTFKAGAPQTVDVFQFAIPAQ